MLFLQHTAHINYTDCIFLSILNVRSYRIIAGMFDFRNAGSAAAVNRRRSITFNFECGTESLTDIFRNFKMKFAAVLSKRDFLPLTGDFQSLALQTGQSIKCRMILHYDKKIVL